MEKTYSAEWFSTTLRLATTEHEPPTNTGIMEVNCPVHFCTYEFRCISTHLTTKNKTYIHEHIILKTIILQLIVLLDHPFHRLPGFSGVALPTQK
jgi:hypothetical protein